MNQKLREALLSEFSSLYPDPKSELNFNNEFQLIISVVLSAQCTDKKVNQVTPSLFSEFPDFKRLCKAPLKRVESIIRPINYYRTKAKNIIQLAKIIERDHGGTVPLNFEELLALPGVGQKTASVVLGELGALHTFPVDTHVFRVSQRLGLASGKTPKEIEAQLKKRFAPTDWRNLHHWLIFHGRRVCKAARPLCENCPLSKRCPAYRKLFRRAP